MELSLSTSDWTSLSLDRLDNDIGYTVKNTILVTKFVNQAKNRLKYEEFKHHIKEMYKGILETEETEYLIGHGCGLLG